MTQAALAFKRFDRACGLPPKNGLLIVMGQQNRIPGNEPEGTSKAAVL